MAKDKEKTNVCRILDQKKIAYKIYNYSDSDAVGGMDVASVLGEDPERCFKTLVTVASSKNHYVFMLPVNKELDLKKAAKCVGEKKIEMIKSKELLPLTGYIHGGCSPIGMKKMFTTVLHSSGLDFETVFFSGGKIGYQVEVAPNDLKKIVNYKTADITT